MLADAWYSGLTDLSPVTMKAYRRRLDVQILPALGQLRVRELTAGVLDRHLRAITATHGVATARMCRSVLSGMCTVTVAQLRQLSAAVSYDDRAIARDLPDLVAFLMATGLRIGEACGLAWTAVDLNAGTIDVRAAVVRVTGRGLVVKKTETDTGARTLVLPQWCVAMLRDRATRDQPLEGSRPVFPAPLGGWRDPSNTQADLRQAVDTAGFDWVTSHVLRKTVATLMDQAGLSSRAAADQLRHANTSFSLHARRT